MKRRVRDGKVSSSMLVVLALLLVSAAALWALRTHGLDAELEAARVEVDDYPIWCPACRHEGRVPADQTDQVARRDGKLQCPQCREFTAQWGPPIEAGKMVMP